MKQQAFENLYGSQWDAFEQLLSSQEKARSRVLHRHGRQGDPIRSEDFAGAYRRLCHHQAVAHKRDYSRHLLNRLDNLALRGYQVLYRPKAGTLRQFMEFTLFGFPRTFRQEYRLIILAHLLFYLPGVLFMIAALIDPQLIYTVMPPASVSNLEEMYNPANDIFGEGRNAGSDFQMFGFYILNNIGIAFRTFASGIFLGLGAIFILIFNGLMIGAACAQMIIVGYQESFFSFVIGHGSFELTAITIAGAAGLKIGFSLLAPGQYRRGEALLRAAGTAGRLVAGAGLMLFVAAFIEGYWSSSSTVLPLVKFITGGLLWILVFCYLLLSGRRRGPA